MSNHNYAISALAPYFRWAACQDEEKRDLFDPLGDDETRSDARERQRKAVEICGLCPHKAKCREWAIDNHHDPRNVIGPVYGGTTSFERRAHRRTNSIASPPRLTILDLYEPARPAPRPAGTDCGHPRVWDSDGYLIRCRECERTRLRERRRAARVEREERRTA
jgi:hypothetical protein